MGLTVVMHMPGVGRAALVQILSKHFDVKQPYSTALMKYYIQGSGEAFDLNKMGPIPNEWQGWIAKQTGGKVGKHSLNPYNAKPFIPDLKNSLGHFDVVITANQGSSVKTYKIQKDSYKFGFKPHDTHHTGQHGFELPFMSDSEAKNLEGLLPTGKYKNPGGFREKFELKKVNGKWTLYIPQQVLASIGKPFPVYGEFKR
jgi:hypothetical protein